MECDLSAPLLTYMSRTDDAIDIAFRGALWLSGVAFIGLGLYWFAMSAYGWMRYGQWVTGSMIDAICWGLECSPLGWLASPTDWIGLHDAIAWVPAPFGLIGIGAILWAASVKH